jgi:hypothetical protein
LHFKVKNTIFFFANLGRLIGHSLPDRGQREQMREPLFWFEKTKPDKLPCNDGIIGVMTNVR